MGKTGTILCTFSTYVLGCTFFLLERCHFSKKDRLFVGRFLFLSYLFSSSSRHFFDTNIRRHYHSHAAEYARRLTSYVVEKKLAQYRYHLAASCSNRHLLL